MRLSTALRWIKMYTYEDLVTQTWLPITTVLCKARSWTSRSRSMFDHYQNWLELSDLETWCWQTTCHREFCKSDNTHQYLFLLHIKNTTSMLQIICTSSDVATRYPISSALIWLLWRSYLLPCNRDSQLRRYFYQMLSVLRLRNVFNTNLAPRMGQVFTHNKHRFNKPCTGTK